MHIIKSKKHSISKQRTKKKKYNSRSHYSQRGSITVLVTLLLIPTVFLTGFLVDISRLKLFSSQAAMCADNYGSAVLSEYDNLLKELYGLFAISQSDEGKAALNNLQEVMKKNFYDAGSSSAADFWVYKNAEVEFSYKDIEGANLGNVGSKNKSGLGEFQTQVNDFMKYRIIQIMLEKDEDSGILDAFEKMSQTKTDSEVIDKSNELSECATNLYEELRKIYNTLKEFKKFPQYLEDLNTSIDIANDSLIPFTEAGEDENFYDSYRVYCEILNPTPDMEEELPAEDETEEEKKKKQEEKEAQEVFEKETKQAIENYVKHELKRGNDPDNPKPLERMEMLPGKGALNLEQFSDFIRRQLEPQTRKVENQMKIVRQKVNEVRQLLDSGKVSDELRYGDSGEEGAIDADGGIEAEIQKLEELLRPEGFYDGLLSYVKENEADVMYMGQEYQNRIQTYKDNLDTLLNGKPEYVENLEHLTIQYQDFYMEEDYREAYDQLEDYFQKLETDPEKEKAANNKKEAVKKAKNENADALKQEEEGNPNVRDIPDSIKNELLGINEKSVQGLDVSSLFKDLGKFIMSDGASGVANGMLSKYYMLCYDGGMFTDRLNVEDTTGGDITIPTESLNGIEFTKKINYLYGAELEYLYGGRTSSKDNWNDVRNKIILFRMIMNFRSTYQIRSINRAINSTADAVSAALTPLIGFAVNMGIRTAFATTESLKDWEALKAGKKVLLSKNSISDLSENGKGLLESLVDNNNIGANSPKEGKKPKLDYNQYLQVLLLFFTPSDILSKRTTDLITMNVSMAYYGKNPPDTLDSLQFQMKKAVTAVEASCQGNIKFVVMRPGFAKTVLDGDGYQQLTKLENRKYKFTVTRGY